MLKLLFYLELCTYFAELKDWIKTSEFDFNTFLRERHLSLLAKLVQDAQIPGPELMLELRQILTPVGTIYASDPRLSLLSSTLYDNFEKFSYGHPEASPFSNLACTFWQVKDLALLGGEIGQHYLQNYVLRQAAQMILQAKLEENVAVMDGASVLTAEAASLNQNPDIAPSLAAIQITSAHQSGIATPLPKRLESNDAMVDTEVVTKAAPSNRKISSFFTIAKRPAAESKPERVPGEYFQPFFIRPGVTLAPINALSEPYLLMQSNNSQMALPDTHEAYWRQFAQTRVQAANFQRKPQCLCVGPDGKSDHAVMKLLHFAENYRPAYYGTWRKSPENNSCSARKPFGRIPSLDYEFDSDAEWEDAEEEADGESLSSISDEENEDDGSELEDMTDASGSEDVNNLFHIDWSFILYRAG